MSYVKKMEKLFIEKEAAKVKELAETQRLKLQEEFQKIYQHPNFTKDLQKALHSRGVYSHGSSYSLGSVRRSGGSSKHTKTKNHKKKGNKRKSNKSHKK